MKINKYNIAENIMANEMGRFEGVMTAEEQRKIFGAYLFGKKYITIDMRNQGRIFGNYRVAFGQDWNSFEFTFDEIAKAVNENRKLNVSLL